MQTNPPGSSDIWVKDVVEGQKLRAACPAQPSAVETHPLPPAHVKLKHQNLGLDTLEKRRRIQDMVETFRILCSKNDGYASGLLETVRTTGARTRQAAEPLNLVHKYARIEVRRKRFSMRVAESSFPEKPEKQKMFSSSKDC